MNSVTTTTRRPGPVGSTDWVPRITLVLERYALAWLLLVLIAFFAVWPTTSEGFTSLANIRNLLANQAVMVIMALGAMIPFSARQFDLTAGPTVIASSIAVAAVATKTELPLLVALVAGVALGVAIGAASGFVVGWVGAEPIIITLGVSVLTGGVVRLATGGQSILGLPAGFTDFGNGQSLGVPTPVWLLIVIIAAVGYLMRYTVSGRRLLMLGSNERASVLVGVPRRRMILFAFAAAGGLYGVAGVVYLSRIGAANPSEGAGLTLGALTAVFLGATSIRPGHFNVPGTVIGVFFIAVSVNGLTLAGAADWVEPTFTGSALVLAVSLSTLLVRRRSGA